MTRFGRGFKKNLEALLPGRQVRLVPLTDWPSTALGPEEGSLVLPLGYRGRELGFLLISPGEPEVELLEEMVRQALENMWLRKALLTDRETGLYSRDYFYRHLLASLRKHRRQGAAKSLSMDEGSVPELCLVMAELREVAEPGPALAALADRLAVHFPLKRPARLSAKRLAFLIEGHPEEIRITLEAALDEQVTAEPSTRPVAAWARYPHDLGGPGTEDDQAGLRRQAQALWQKAEVALFYARQSRSSVLALAFGDLIEHHGQVVQVLPQGRVVINLGRETGAAAGQVYLVGPPQSRPSAEPEYKAEITIYETADSYSLASITGLKPSRGLVAGDRLTFSRRDYNAAGEYFRRPAPAGFLAGLPDRANFMARFDGFRGETLSLALFQLDAFDKTLAVAGGEEAERLLTFIFEKVVSALPVTDLKTLWRTETLALAWPGLSIKALEDQTRTLVAALRESGPISAGLVYSSGGAESAEALMSDARKALHEAAYSGHGQVAVFGPLSLNISGDRLFEDGNLPGALEEYERGLSLAPDDLNLLNSLGVCQGRMGDLNRALETFEKISRLDCRNMMAHYNLGYTHLLAGRLAEAEQALARAAELAPDNFESLFHLGKTALDLGHLDRALPALKKAGELESARPVVFRLLGEALMLANEHQTALAAFKKAVKNAPNDAYALSALGALFVDLANDLEPARSLFQRSVEIDPTNCLYRQRLGRLLFTMGDFEGSEHHLNMAVEYGSRSPEVHYHLGRLAEENGRSGEALKHFKAALAQDPAYQPALERVSPERG